MISGSGSSTLHVHDTTDPSFPLKQSISDAHKLGCHHVCTSRNGNVAASAGFGGEVKIWKVDSDTGEWSLDGEIRGSSSKPGEAWAMALSENGSYLATTTNDGRVNVWDVMGEKKPKIREYETGSAGSGSFGMSVDLSRDGKYTASGHQNGSVYIFNNDTGRVLYSLSGRLPRTPLTYYFSDMCYQVSQSLYDQLPFLLVTLDLLLQVTLESSHSTT